MKETRVGILPEAETAWVGDLDVIEIPELEFDKRVTESRLKMCEGMETIYQKISYLRGILHSKGAQNYRLSKDLVRYIKVAEEVFAANENRLPEYINAQLVENLIRKEIPTMKQIGIYRNGSTRDEEIKNALSTDFRRNKGNKVCISRSHGATWFELKAVHEAKENKRDQIAVIVFDNHVDMYRSFLDPIVHKGNIFRSLGDNGMIERATFIGGIDQEVMITKENDVAKKRGKTVRYKQIGINNLKPNEVTKREVLLRRLEETIEGYKKNGVTSVVFSIDMDVLNAKKMGYTGFEYNPMEMLRYISSLHLPLERDSSELTQSEIDHITREVVSQMWFKEDLRSFDPKGLALGDIGVSLDAISENCKKYGLNFGVKLAAGGTYFGDVVEMGGPDYKGRTATASVALLKRIERIVQNQ